MPDEPEITLAFISRQLDRVLERLGAVEDKIEILTGVAVRNDGVAQEVSGMRQLVMRLDRRMRSVEDKMQA